MPFKRFRPSCLQSWHSHISWTSLTDNHKWTRTHSHTDPMSGARILRRNSLPKRSLEGLQTVSDKRPRISTVPASGWSSTTEVPPPASALKSPVASGRGKSSIPSLGGELRYGSSGTTAKGPGFRELLRCRVVHTHSPEGPGAQAVQLH